MELRKILYVDDEPDMREIVVMSLEVVGGFEVRSFENGAAAIEDAVAYRPDLLLLDVMMPGMTGPETLSRLRRISVTAETPAIFLTAKAQRHDIETLRQNRRADVIPKPFDVMELPAAIHNAWSRLAQLP